MPLYNCRHAGDQYRITKFTENMDVESSYLCTTDECDCPAGVRPTCRHRQMLPRFLSRNAVGNEWFFDYDRGGWVQMGNEWAAEVLNTSRAEEPAPAKEPTLTGLQEEQILMGFHQPSVEWAVPAKEPASPHEEAASNAGDVGKSRHLHVSGSLGASIRRRLAR